MEKKGLFLVNRINPSLPFLIDTAHSLLSQRKLTRGKRLSPKTVNRSHGDARIVF
jgi:hypothetical protein